MTTAYRDRPIRRGEGEYLRSNKPQTEFACSHLDFFLTGNYRGSGQRTRGKTTVVYEIENRVQSFKVLISGQEVLSVLLEEWKPFSVRVSFSEHCDHKGKPITAERLNGLLDRLGAYEILPKGVRIFYDSTEKLIYLGKGDNKIAVGEEYAREVYVRPNQEELDIVGSVLYHEV